MTEPRTFEKYQALDDAADRWPGWLFATTDLNGLSEIICSDGRLVLVDLKRWPEGAAFAFAHAVAHLDLGHHLVPPGGCYAESERQADWLAVVRLDRESTRDTLTG